MIITQNMTLDEVVVSEKVQHSLYFFSLDTTSEVHFKI